MVGLITLVGIGGYVGYWKHQQNKSHLAVTNDTDNGEDSLEN